jgi:hypothetical protein
MTAAELETIMFIGLGALARCVDPEKLPLALETINAVIGNDRAKLTEAERSALQFLFDVIELRNCPIEIDSAKLPGAHLKIVD